MRTLLTTLLALVFAGVVGTLAGAGASAQVQQSGTVTAGHPVQWVTNNVIKDGGAATNGSLTGVGIQSSNGCSLGINSGAVTGSYTQLCIGVSPTSGSIFFNDTAFGGATHIPIVFTVNSNPSLTINDSGILVNGQPVGGTTIPNNTLLGNNTGITAAPVALSPSAVTTLLGLGTAAFVNTGTSGATIPLLSTANTWGATQTFPGASIPVSALATINGGTVLGNVTGSTGSPTATAQPVLGVIGSTGGQLTLAGSSTGSATVRVPAAAGTGTIFQLPATNGSNTQVLQTDGSGNTSWVSIVGGGTVNAGTAGQLGYYATSTNAISGNTLANISSGALTLGLANTTAGSITLEGSTSGSGVIQVAAAAGSGIVFQLPSSNGTNTQFLQTNGSGVTSWATPTGSGTVNAGTAGQMTYYATTASAVSGNVNANISSGTLTLGLASTTAGAVVLEGGTSGAITVAVPAVAGSHTLTLPATTGTAITSGDANTVTLGMVAQSVANTMLGNWTNSTANVSANAMPSCADTGGNHLNYVSGSGVTCGTSGGGSSAWTLVSTQTASNSTSLAFTGLSATPNTYAMQCNALVPATGGQGMLIQTGEGGTPTWNTSNYFYSAQQASSANAVTNAGSVSTTAVRPTPAGLGTTSSDGFGMTVWVNNVGSSSVHKAIFGQANYSDDTNTYATQFAGQYSGSTNAVTGLRISMTSGNITSGQCSLYSLSN